MRVLILLMLPLAAAAAEPALPLSRDTYEVSWRDYELGDGEVRLQAATRPNCYRYTSQTHPAALVRMFYGAPSESSEFCVENGRVRPRHFEYKGNEDDSFTLDFNWKTRKIRGGKLPERALPADGIDHFSIQQMVRLWALKNAYRKMPGSLKLTLMEKDNALSFRFVIGGPETVETPAGSFACIRVDLKDDPQRQIHYWFAPERDWSLIQMERIKNGKQQLKLVLKS